jgi:hypothetical protein
MTESMEIRVGSAKNCLGFQFYSTGPAVSSFNDFVSRNVDVGR